MLMTEPRRQVERRDVSRRFRIRGLILGLAARGKIAKQIYSKFQAWGITNVSERSIWRTIAENGDRRK